MKKFIYPYNTGSASVKALSKALKSADESMVGVIRREGSKFQPGPSKMIINWGSADKQILAYAEGGSVVLNHPNAVNLCADKLRFFDAVKDNASVPEFTTDRALAERWVNEGTIVVGRLDLRASAGRGIVMSDDGDAIFPECKLFCKYIPKLSEFRVHIFRGRVLDVAQKKLRKTDQEGREVDPDNVNWRIRSYSNGFVFAREDIKVPDSVINESLAAFNCIRGLDFGAFDVIYNKKRNQAYVLECNTAPGIEGTTLENYTEAFRNA